jgi:hypothetical protein
LKHRQEDLERNFKCTCRKHAACYGEKHKQAP